MVRRRPNGGGRSTSATITPLGQHPPLDGLRAVAVTAVLLYHARFGWITGGFLGVSLFFTLSGFLITSLLLREWAGEDGIDLRTFWRRRFRRLLPASWATIGVVLLMGAVGIWNTDQLRSLRGDVPFALLEVINWHFIAQGRSYGAGFSAPSPLEHFWSLAIEQQFYLLLPLLLAGVLAATARRSARDGRRTGSTGPRLRPLVTVLSVIGLASVACNWWWAQGGTDRAYFGTISRMFELIIGALLACALLRGTRLVSATARRAAEVGAVVGLLLSMVAWHVATVGSTWMYPLGFLGVAVCSSALILGALQGGLPARALSLPPLLWLGRISYGVYLLHWPIFLWLTPERTGWAPWPLFALRMAVTLLAAVLMFRLLERPVRVGGLLRDRQALYGAPIAAVVLLGATAMVTSGLPAPTSLERAATATTTAPPKPLRVLVVGDQLAGSVEGHFDVGGATPMTVTVSSAPDCGLSTGGYVRLSDGQVERDVDRCGKAAELWKAAVDHDQPDVVVIWAGLRDTSDRRLAATDPWVAPGDPALSELQAADVGSLIDTLGSTGARVVVMSAPHIRNEAAAPAAIPTQLPPEPERAVLVAQEAAQAASGAPPAGHSENDDARVDAWNQVLASSAAAHGATFLDVGAEMRTWPDGELDPARRDGGVGLTPAGAKAIAAWLAPQLRDLKVVAPTPAPASALDAGKNLPAAPPVTPRRTVPAGRAVDTLVVGDSVGYGYAFGLEQWAKTHRDIQVTNGAKLGCPIARGGSYRFLRDVARFEDRCDWGVLFPQLLKEQNPAVVVLTSGIWEVVDRRFPGDDRWRHIGQPEVDQYILSEFLSAIDLLGANGATVAVLTYPHFEAGADQGFTDLPESDPARVDRLNELLRQAVAARPGISRLIDIQAWHAQQPGGEIDLARRPDGLHFSDAYVPTIGAWLGPQLVAIGRSPSV